MSERKTAWDRGWEIDPVPEQVWLQIGVGDGGSHTWCAEEVMPDEEPGSEVGPYAHPDRIAELEVIVQAAKHFLHAWDEDTKANAACEHGPETQDAVDRSIADLRALVDPIPWRSEESR